ncbi:hypothetical protein IMG5_118160 [Ichthyophthirius multifiliis]|uniref:alpha-amylase n=1 Tax=Ichthyophthirius multifiliis TaxID=5932 RepID=G0QUK7_ICHMU|nr:hypothetical protein IMG5_118160 [Ichthyophthirius multifiliis]EGR31091.1 hypothetical protein IMG5_118160 [Ichthyophthirius multifiliis]|eukprot:XP_004034577.1 hypothetical protein IMG5_118160 [Ichthyophthirius multifiliis]
MKLIIKLAFLSLFISFIYSRTAQEWKSRTIYQIITDRFAIGDRSRPPCDLSHQPQYCGGNFQGIINNLDYIKELGFNAIWISPIPLNQDNQFHGYAAKDLSRINPNFGGEQGLKDLVDACHLKDIWVMVDVVGNHMGNIDLNFSSNYPFNIAEYYHEYCIITDLDFSSKNMKNIQNCRLAGLADLNTEHPYVQNYLFNWIKNLVQTYNIDGLRIDTVPEVPHAFWKNYTQSAGVFSIGEVFDSSFSYVGGYISSVGSVLNYPYYFTVKDIFVNQKDMNEIRSYYSQWQQQNQDVSILAQFVDNHDNPRFLSTPGRSQDQLKTLLKSYTVLTLCSIGIPIFYYGTEQYYAGGQDPYNREPLWNNLNTNSEMYLYVKTILQAKNSNLNFQNKKNNFGGTDINDFPQTESYVDSDFYAFYRGQLWVGVTNKFNFITRIIINHPFKNGDVICNVFWPNNDCIVIQNNSFVANLNNGEAKIYVIQSQTSSQ